MGRRWVVEVAEYPPTKHGPGGTMYCGDKSWVTGILETKPVTAPYAKFFITKKEAEEGAKLRGFKSFKAVRKTWWGR